jgi:hypothetical protein
MDIGRPAVKVLPDDPKRRADLTIAAGCVGLAIAASLWWLPAGIAVASAALVLAGLFGMNVTGR